MTRAVRKGQDWGEPGRLPEGAPVVATDRELRAIVETALRAGETPPVVGLLGGDLAATLGSPGREERLHGPEAYRLNIDVGEITLDSGTSFWFVSHCVARRSWWRGQLVLIANAAWHGAWNVAPKAHPGDGRQDFFMSNLSPGERWRGRQRLPHGGHVPHPAVVNRRVTSLEEKFDRALDVYLDGDKVGRSTTLALSVLPARLTVII